GNVAPTAPFAGHGQQPSPAEVSYFMERNPEMVAQVARRFGVTAVTAATMLMMTHPAAHAQEQELQPPMFQHGGGVKYQGDYQGMTGMPVPTDEELRRIANQPRQNPEYIGHLTPEQGWATNTTTRAPGIGSLARSGYLFNPDA